MASAIYDCYYRPYTERQVWFCPIWMLAYAYDEGQNSGDRWGRTVEEGEEMRGGLGREEGDK